MSNEDDIIYWDPVLEAILGDRKLPKCPFCYEGDIIVTKRDRMTRVECGRCHHYIEGRFRDEDVAKD